MFCPQCGAQLGEGAAGCAACGWSSSRKTLWIVLGSIFGLLFLVCCGGATWGFLKIKKAGEAVAAKSTPAILAYHRLSVLNFAQKRGALPESLAQAAEEKLVLEDHAAAGAADGEAGAAGEPGAAEPDAHGGKTTFKFDMKADGQDADSWQNPLRYTPGADGTYEIRSAGSDGIFDNEDDLTVKGSSGDDLAAVTREFEALVEEISNEFVRALGIDPEEVDMGGRKPGPAPPAPAPAPPPPEAPPAPAPGGGK